MQSEAAALAPTKEDMFPADMEKLVHHYRRGGSRHGLRESTSYIDAPKDDGYRSHHLVLDYCPPTSLTKSLERERGAEPARAQAQARARTGLG
jgi:ppGpp synthetase/RelA/SpoT-type nucleotidyltranferase